MKLVSIRDLKGLAPVLKERAAKGPDTAYWVFTDIGGKWENITLITSGSFSGEYPKTFGHYHGAEVPETYHLVAGSGVLVMQKKLFMNGAWIQDQVESVYLVKAKPGDEIVITPEWGHSWSNVGKTALLSYDDWRAGHSPADYEVIEKLQGLAYYLVEEGGEIKAVANSNYKDLPEPKWVNAEEFKELTTSQSKS